MYDLKEYKHFSGNTVNIKALKRRILQRVSYMVKKLRLILNIWPLIHRGFGRPHLLSGGGTFMSSKG
jgi:hypothetical protein